MAGLRRIYLLVAGLGKKSMNDAALRLAESARESLWFDDVICENNISFGTIHRAFLKEFQTFMKDPANRRGYGHYIWKPYLVAYWLDRIEKDDLLVYLDAGCHLNWENETAHTRFDEYVQLARENSGLAMQLRSGSFGYPDLRELSWSRKDLMDFLSVPEEHRQTNQIQSGIIFLNKDSGSMEYANKWYEIAVLQNCFFLDDRTIDQTEDLLIQSRWEQSIHSILFKKFKFHAIMDETTFGPNWPPDWESLGREFPIWAMRNRSGADPFKFKLSNFRYRIHQKVDDFFAK